MRVARFKIPPSEGAAAYHVISRTVNGERILDDVAKEVLRKHLWQTSDYCGVKIVTYTLLSNHFHILVLVPKKVPIPDAELLRRYRVLHPRPSRFQTARMEVIESQLESNGPLAVAWRQRQLAQMGDVSPFMKLLKQRFSIWFNESHGRFGTLWAERFKSHLIQPARHSLKMAAAYIDLNCVRAGLCTDPLRYRFCGYAEAVAGNERAQQGLQLIFGTAKWAQAHASYRLLFTAAGAVEKEGKASISRSDFETVVKAGGQLPLGCALLCRIRYFSDGVALGSRAFVEVQLDRYRMKTGRRTRTAVRPLPAHIADWGDLVVLRGLRKEAISFPTV